MSHAADVHVTSPAHELGPLHVTSHAHELLHATSLHDSWAVQLTLHLPVPHWIPSHDDLPEHANEHDAAPTQLTPLRHELSVSQRMLHAKFAGQEKCELHAPLAIAQSIVHV
jgi:hypothetical protein